jgi:hypothetical protein
MLCIVNQTGPMGYSLRHGTMVTSRLLLHCCEQKWSILTPGEIVVCLCGGISLSRIYIAVTKASCGLLAFTAVVYGRYKPHTTPDPALCLALVGRQDNGRLAACPRPLPSSVGLLGAHSVTPTPLLAGSNRGGHPYRYQPRPTLLNFDEECLTTMPLRYWVPPHAGISF